MPRSPDPDRCSVIELRQYTLRPGQRDVLIELFEREFIEAQEAEGIAVLGTFCDLDDPDRFVWWRGFADMPARAHALQAFYGGPVWQTHRDAANATMIDSDDVLLLRPLAGHAALVAPGRSRAPRGTGMAPVGVLLVTLCALPPRQDARLDALAAQAIAAAMQSTGTGVIGACISETAPNNFARLPVREGENVVLWCSLLPDRAACERHEAARRVQPAWERLLPHLHEPPTVLRLAPTSRSLIQL